jgi:hypothetical protein
MPETPKDECWCSKDPDGRCVSCSERLSGIIYQLMDATLTIPKMMNSLCLPCKKSNVDWAGAKAIRDIMAAHPGMRDVSAITAFVNNFVSSSDITKTPLMDAEIRRLSETKKNEAEGENPSSKI